MERLFRYEKKKLVKLRRCAHTKWVFPEEATCSFLVTLLVSINSILCLLIHLAICSGLLEMQRNLQVLPPVCMDQRAAILNLSPFYNLPFIQLLIGHMSQIVTVTNGGVHRVEKFITNGITVYQLPQKLIQKEGRRRSDLQPRR